MKRWRLAKFHPEDRFEPDDEVADGMRVRIKAIQDHITHADSTHDRSVSVNKLLRERDKIQIELAERLYGK